MLLLLFCMVLFQDCSTVLHLASKHGHTQTCSILLDSSSVDINSKDNVIRYLHPFLVQV